MTVLKAHFIPIRDVVVFPRMVVPLFIGREQSVKSLLDAVEHDGKAGGGPRCRGPLRMKRFLELILLYSGSWDFFCVVHVVPGIGRK